MEKSKAFTFIGFAIKARKVKMGVNAVATLKRAEILIVCHTASENTVKDAVSLAKRLGAKLYTLNEVNLSDVTFKDNCKLIAITDKALSEAIRKSDERRLVEYSGGLL